MVSRNTNLLRFYNFFYEFRPYGAIAVIYFAHVTHSYALGLAVFSISAVSNSILQLPTGFLSDRIGRKKTVILGSIASVIALSLYASAHSFPILLLGALFNGLAGASISGNNDALLYDTLKSADREDEFATVHGKVSAMFELGLGISALVATVLALVSLRFVMVASIVPQAICVLIALGFMEPRLHTEEIASDLYNHLKGALKSFKRNAKLRKLSIAYIVDFAVQEAIYNFKPAFNSLLWPNWALGIARALDNTFGFLGFHFAGKLIDRYTALKTLFVQQVLGLADGLIFAGFPNVISPIMLSGNAFAYGVGVTANQTLMQKEFTDKQRATMGSLNSLGGNLLYAVVTFCVGLVADGIGPARTMLVLIVVSIPAVFLYRGLYRKHAHDTL
ncbi:MAG TPA: MFS transporter [Candidatus Saccharimonadales bacterium]|nr:MFS transporter [Candidatus Saccharimonadales bacterium]